jgi:U3 small nucleolar RNA-associated protein 6
MKLEELRQARKHKLRVKGKKGLAEVCIVRRIHFIFERASRKFRSDITLWLRWIEVCKQYKSTKQLSKVGMSCGTVSCRGPAARSSSAG